MIELTDTNSSAIAAEFVRGRMRAGSPAMGMVMTLIVVVDEDDAVGRDGRRQGGVARAPGAGARRDPRRRPRRGRDQRPGRHRPGLVRRDRADPAQRRGRQAPRVGGAAAAAARLPRRRLVAHRPPRRPGGRPARQARQAPDHRLGRSCRAARSRRCAASARPTPPATPTWPGPGSPRGGRCSRRRSTSTRSRCDGCAWPPSGSAPAPTCCWPGSPTGCGSPPSAPARRGPASPRS